MATNQPPETDTETETETDDAQDDDIDYRYKNRDWLRFQFYTRGRSTTEIAEIANADPGTISYHRREKHGFEKPEDNEGFLRHLHEDMELSVEEIADFLSPEASTIRDRFKDFGIGGPQWDEWTFSTFEDVDVDDLRQWMADGIRVVVFTGGEKGKHRPTPDNAEIIHDDSLDTDIIGSLIYNAGPNTHVAIEDQ